MAIIGRVTMTNKLTIYGKRARFGEIDKNLNRICFEEAIFQGLQRQ